MNCGKCKAVIDLEKEPFISKNGKRFKKCPACGNKYILIRQPIGLTRDTEGKYINKNKVRMSKKKRLKLRRKEAVN